MRPNIGMINALIRITCGFTMLAWATAKLVKRPWCNSYLIVAILGGMKVGEGITRFCPLTEIYNRYQDQQQTDEEAKEAINPT